MHHAGKGISLTMVLNHFFNLYGNPTPTLSKRPEKGKKSLVVKNTKKESIKNKYSEYKRREESSSYNEVNQIHTDDKRQ